jgi:hypothetical protein
MSDYELGRLISRRLCVCEPYHAWFCYCGSAVKSAQAMAFLRKLDEREVTP